MNKVIWAVISLTCLVSIRQAHAEAVRIVCTKSDNSEKITFDATDNHVISGGKTISVEAVLMVPTVISFWLDPEVTLFAEGTKQIFIDRQKGEIFTFAPKKEWGSCVESELKAPPNFRPLDI
jgi:hypothetical protein